MVEVMKRFRAASSVALRLGSVLAIGLIALAPAALTTAQPERLVLALYYPWYGLDTWADPVLSDTPTEPYFGTDPDAIARHVGWAKDAGIDVLVSAWFGPADNNPTESAFRTLLDAAATQGMHAALMSETDNPAFFPSYGAQRDALAYALSVHAQHPAYLRQDGRPVVFVWRPRGIVAGGARANRDGPAAVQAWRQLRDEVDPDRGAVWIAETETPGYLDVFDGMFFYNVAGLADPAGLMARLGGAVRSVGDDKLWIATTMPGYDDTRLLDRRDRFAVDLGGGAFFRRTFDAAAASAPDWIMITSFNEWVEGSQIEPSVSYGSLYLDVSRELVSAWKAE
jgi:Glycosyl hydrolase family 99